jgi:hypothetical protein
MTSTSRQFGLAIAYILPGFIVLIGMVPLFPAVGKWLLPAPAATDLSVGLGPPLYAVMTATALGLVLSCFRWLTIDHLHAWTGLRRPAWNDARLDDLIDGFDYLVQNHWRYYEACGNTLLAVLFAYVTYRVGNSHAVLGTATDLATLVTLLALFAASRNALRNYYDRTHRLIGRARPDRRSKHVQRQ